MKIKMISTKPGSENGINVNIYREGEIYNISDKLGDIFLEMKCAIKLVEIVNNEPEQEVVIEKKKIDETPNNKMIDSENIIQNKKIKKNKNVEE